MKTMHIVQWLPENKDKQEKPKWFLDAEKAGDITRNGRLLTDKCGTGIRNVLPENYVALASDGRLYAHTKETIESKWEEDKEQVEQYIIEDTESGIEIILNPTKDSTRIQITGPLSVNIAGKIVNMIV